MNGQKSFRRGKKHNLSKFIDLQIFLLYTNLSDIFDKRRDAQLFPIRNQHSGFAIARWCVKPMVKPFIIACASSQFIAADRKLQ
jgi:hypothetical protein